jgi:hypothetical protein
MPQVIQAKCPNCTNTLRIPAEWLAQPIRCKHCKQIFQMKARSAPAPVAFAAPDAAAKVAVAQPVNATAMMPQTAVVMPRPGSNDPFGFDADDAPTPTPDIARKPRKKGRGTLVLLGVFFFLFVGFASGASLLVYWAFNLQKEKAQTRLVAENDGNREVIGADGKPAAEKGDAPKKPLPGAKDKGKKDGGKPRTSNEDPFPRRALLISVNGYLMFNPVHYGSGQDDFKGGYPGSSTAVLRDNLTRIPMRFPLSQVVELSDGMAEPRLDKLPPNYPKESIPRPHSTQKSVLETTIKDFVNTCRDQDRIMIVFAGHGAYIEDPEPEDAKKDENKKPTGKAYLVPIDGNLKKPESLLTVKWVLNQLAQCKAQQKILVLDVFRYSPSRGFDMASPGEGEEGKMPEAFDKELENPPAGVQVWTSCIKDQSSIELDLGSAFLQALCHSLQGEAKMGGFSEAPQPIPIENLVVKVNQKLKDLLSPEKRTQLSRLSGKSVGGVAYNRDEQLAASIMPLKAPMAAGAQAAGYAAIDNILKEIGELPPARETRGSGVIRAANLPAFAAKKIDIYKADGNVADLHKLYKKDAVAYAKEFPLRAAYFEAVDALKESTKISMREVLPGPVNPKDKTKFLKEQEPMGMSIFKLEQVLASVKDAGEKRDMETSKRWLANFDYAQGRLQSRLMYLFEYNYTLGQIRADNLPELAPGQSGWRIGVNSDKLNVTEKKAKDLRNDTKKVWARIQKEHEGTPWELLAQRESMVRLGLVWRPKSD